MNPTQNKHSDPQENSLPFARRLFIYQKERFPLAGHGLLIAAFTFSAISYSRICRNVPGFISPGTYLCGVIITLTLFLLLRILDEFKDADDDAAFRPHLPVPRGVISFKELRRIGAAAVIIQLSVITIFFPRMLLLYLPVVTYLYLMTKEFFAAAWLRKHQFWYVTSHMLIIPLVDVFASGLDWFLDDSPAPTGLLFFFIVSFFNGIVLEIGRKLRAPGHEIDGVQTYSAMLGPVRATWLWLLVLFITLVSALAAARFAGYGIAAIGILGGIFVVCSIPALIFLRTRQQRQTKQIELLSGIWTISMYLVLGLMPMLQRLLFGT